MPTNAKMPELKKAFEKAGFEDVTTVLGSGNVVFGASTKSLPALEKACEDAMQKHLGRSFSTLVRPVNALKALVAADPYAQFRLTAAHKRVVTFLREAPETSPKLPIELEGARILLLRGLEVFSAYVPGPKGPVFMSLLEKTFGKDVTTRTWDTVVKVCR
jgi:uncharacterized protein (DUF1697 family)